jgi:hypothetical protein
VSDNGCIILKSLLPDGTKIGQNAEFRKSFKNLFYSAGEKEEAGFVRISVFRKEILCFSEFMFLDFSSSYFSSEENDNEMDDKKLSFLIGKLKSRHRKRQLYTTSISTFLYTTVFYLLFSFSSLHEFTASFSGFI